MFMKKVFLVVAVCAALFAVPALALESEDILGENNNGVYTNKVMGAEAKFSKDWKIFTPREIAALTGAISSTTPTAKEILENNSPFFLAITGDGMSNINITADTLNPTGKALIAESRDLFVEIRMNVAVEGIRRANSANKLENVAIERVSVNFLDEKCPAVLVTGTYRDITMYQKQVMFLTENYIFNVTATSVGKDRTEDMLSLFRKSDSN